MATKSDRPAIDLITPLVTGVWPKLNEPDTKYVDDGVYETKMRFSPEAEDALVAKKPATWAEVLEAVDAQQKAFFEAKKAELAKGTGPQKKKAKEIDSIPWGREPDYDDEGEETGDTMLKAKMYATFKDRNGNVRDRKPRIFDAKGNLLKDPPLIYSGTKMKVAGRVVPYYNAKDNVVGSTMYLEAVQIIDLVTGGGRSAEAYGFGAEDGYTTSDDDDAPFEAAEDSDNSAPASANF